MTAHQRFKKEVWWLAWGERMKDKCYSRHIIKVIFEQITRNSSKLDKQCRQDKFDDQAGEMKLIGRWK